MDIILYFSFLLLLFLPTFIANAVPVIIKNIPWIKDFNKPINEKLFGKNKTYRGFIFGIFFAIIISLLEYKFIKNIQIDFIIENYYMIVDNFYFAIIVGFIQGFGALFGDLIESYFKRKIGKKPGEALIFWDGSDYIISSLILFSFFYIPSIAGIIFLILFAPIISLISNIIAYFLGWKNVWY